MDVVTVGNSVFTRDALYAEQASLVESDAIAERVCRAGGSHQQRVQVDFKHQALLEAGIEQRPVGPLILVSRANAVFSVLPGNLVSQLKLVRGAEVRQPTPEQGKALGEVDEDRRLFESTGSRRNAESGVRAAHGHSRRRVVRIALIRNSRLVYEVVGHERRQLEHRVLVSKHDVFVDTGQVTARLSQERSLWVERIEISRAQSFLAVNYIVAVSDVLILVVNRRNAEKTVELRKTTSIGLPRVAEPWVVLRARDVELPTRQLNLHEREALWAQVRSVA